MGIKKGTKLTDNPKDYMLRVRITQQELNKLDKLCENNSMTRSMFIRHSINEQYKQLKK